MTERLPTDGGDTGTWGAVLNSYLGVSLAADGTLKNVVFGTGSPEGAVTGTVGQLYRRTDGGAGTTLYTKESGSGNTGWVAVKTTGGTVAADAIFDAKGDLPVGTGADTAAKLTVGANSKVLVADSTQTTGAKWDFPPGYEVGYDQITSPVNIASTTEATGTTIITCSAHTFDGAAVMCEFFAPYISTPSTIVATVGISLFESTTEIALIDYIATGTMTNTIYLPAIGKIRFTPSAGSHTYLIKAFVSSTTGTPAVGAGSGGTGGVPPAYVRFTKA